MRRMLPASTSTGSAPPSPVRNGRPDRRAPARPTRYLVGAICIAICTIMVLPLVASVLASVKPTEEAAQTPPTYVPHGFSLDAYRRLWEYQSGLPTYLINSFGTALLTVLFTLVPDDPGRLRPGPLPGSVQGAAVRRCCCSP